MLSPELEEGFLELLEIQLSIRGEPDGAIGAHKVFDATGEDSRNDLSIDGIGEAEPHAGASFHEAEIHDILPVIFREIGGMIAAEHGDEDAFDSFLAESLGERVEVGISALDQDFFGLLDILKGDAFRTHSDEIPDHDVGEGVDEPGLASGEVPDGVESFELKRLPGLGGVLKQE
jgi:hypothetical protein